MHFERMQMELRETCSANSAINDLVWWLASERMSDIKLNQSVQSMNTKKDNVCVQCVGDLVCQIRPSNKLRKLTKRPKLQSVTMYKFNKFKAKRTLQKVTFEYKTKIKIHWKIKAISYFVGLQFYLFFKEIDKAPIIWAVVYLF